MRPIQTQPFQAKPIQTQPFHVNRSQNLKALIVFLLMLALVDSYALARAYVARNSDTVVIIATDHNNVAGGPTILKVVTQHYTGATARKIELAIDTAQYLKPGWNVGAGCIGGTGSDHFYEYRMTFTLAGIVTESVTTSTGGCHWTRSILGLSEAATLTDDNPLIAIYQFTNGALPT